MNRDVTSADVTSLLPENSPCSAMIAQKVVICTRARPNYGVVKCTYQQNFTNLTVIHRFA